MPDLIEKKKTNRDFLVYMKTLAKKNPKIPQSKQSVLSQSMAPVSESII